MKNIHYLSKNQNFTFRFTNIEALHTFKKYAKRTGAIKISIYETEMEDYDYADDRTHITGAGFESPYEVDDISDASLDESYRKWSISFEFPGDISFEPDYYRSGLHYDPTESRAIAESYLILTSGMRIIENHFRTQTAIQSHLQKLGLWFHPKSTTSTDSAFEKQKSAKNDEHNTLKELISDALKFGRCRQINSTEITLPSQTIDEAGYFYLNDLSLQDKRTLIKFVARFISLEAAIDLADTFNLHKLRYLLVLQLHHSIGGPSNESHLNLLKGYISLNKCTPFLSPLLERIRIELLHYLRSVCNQKASSLIAGKDWIKSFFESAKVRTHYLTGEVITTDEEVLKALIPNVLANAGFSRNSEIELAVAVATKDSKHIQQAAVLGDKFARWYCCEQQKRSKANDATFIIHPSWLIETNGVQVDIEKIRRLVTSLLKFDKTIVDNFKERVFTSNYYAYLNYSTYEYPDYIDEDE